TSLLSPLAETTGTQGSPVKFIQRSFLVVVDVQEPSTRWAARLYDLKPALVVVAKNGGLAIAAQFSTVTDHDDRCPAVVEIFSEEAGPCGRGKAIGWDGHDIAKQRRREIRHPAVLVESDLLAAREQNPSRGTG